MAELQPLNERASAPPMTDEEQILIRQHMDTLYGKGYRYCLDAVDVVGEFIKNINKHIADAENRMIPLRFDPGRVQTVKNKDVIMLYQHLHTRFIRGTLEDQMLLESIGLRLYEYFSMRLQVRYIPARDAWCVLTEGKKEFCDGTKIGDTIISMAPTGLKVFYKTTHPVLKELRKYFDFKVENDVISVTQKEGKIFKGYKYEADCDTNGKFIYQVTYDYNNRLFKYELLNKVLKEVNLLQAEAWLENRKIMGHYANSRKPGNMGIMDTDIGKIAVFHNGRKEINKRSLRKFMKLYSKGKVDYFVCCHPDNTDGLDNYHLLGQGNQGLVTQYTHPTNPMKLDFYVEKNTSLDNPTRIYALFAGVGKKYAIKKLEEIGYKVLSIEKEQDFYKRFPTPQSYIDFIQSNKGKYNFIFLPYFLNMEERYLQGKVKYTVVYPNIRLKYEYIRMYKQMGFTDEQIKNFADNWEDMIKDCMKCKNKIELSKGEHFLDKIRY